VTRLLQKNNLSAKQTAKEWAYSECTKRSESTVFLAEPRELVIIIVYSTSILVALKTCSLITNSLASKVVVPPEGALEYEIWWPSLQEHTVEIAYIFMECITLVLVAIIRIEGEKASYFKTEIVQRLHISYMIIKT